MLSDLRDWRECCQTGENAVRLERMLSDWRECCQTGENAVILDRMLSNWTECCQRMLSDRRECCQTGENAVRLERMLSDARQSKHFSDREDSSGLRPLLQAIDLLPVLSATGSANKIRLK